MSKLSAGEELDVCDCGWWVTATKAQPCWLTVGVCTVCALAGAVNKSRLSEEVTVLMAGNFFHSAHVRIMEALSDACFCCRSIPVYLKVGSGDPQRPLMLDLHQET